MSGLIHQKCNSSSIAQQVAQMREKLMIIGEKERILSERSATREAYRYLLDAHHLAATPGPEVALDLTPIGTSETNQLAA